ncbi:MAG TPA: CAP domain-containing protein [Trebonia sp.]|nr:CAP domain-containing protein [Trebonia sp.]
MDRGIRRAAPTGRRVRFLVSGLLVLAVLAGGGFYLARGMFSAGPASGRTAASLRATVAGCGAGAAGSCAGNPAAVAVAASPVLVTGLPRQAGAGPSAPAYARSPSPRPAAPTTGAASASPASATTSATPTTSTASAQPSASAPASPPAVQGGTAAAQVLALINQARSAAGLPALAVTSGLETSSSAHNTLMAGGCGLSHQCPGEPSLGARETAAGVNWTAAGENIGEGGPVADTSAAIAQMAVGLTQSMLNEQPPDDGHRLNILSSTFTHIGIAVYRDSSGTVWLTQDFSN